MGKYVIGFILGILTALSLIMLMGDPSVPPDYKIELQRNGKVGVETKHGVIHIIELEELEEFIEQDNI